MYYRYIFVKLKSDEINVAWGFKRLIKTIFHLEKNVRYVKLHIDHFAGLVS